MKLGDLVLSSGVLALCLGACGSRVTPQSPAAAGSAGSASPTRSPTSSRVAGAVADGVLTKFANDTGRPDVRVCVYVDPGAGLVASSVLSQFQDTVDSLVRDGYTVLGAAPVAECPTALLYLRTGTVAWKNSANGTPAPLVRVTTPSPFLLWIAVTSKARIDSIFGGLVSRRASEEFTCSGDSCGEVTGSIYVEAADVATAARRETVLIEGLGLSGRPGG